MEASKTVFNIPRMVYNRKIKQQWDLFQMFGKNFFLN